MKIIFLDIDGVLNSTTYFMSNKDELKKKTDYKPSYDLDPNAINLLNNLIAETGAKVVVSSTWRSGKEKEELQSILEEKGFKGEVIDKTPYGCYMCVRGNEIYRWLCDNEKIIGKRVSDYDEYVILDDDSDMLYWQRNNFILVDGWVGLTPNICYRARKILNKTYDNLEQI